MSDLDDLYQAIIVDHGKRPRNRGPLPGADRSAAGDNPMCGDQVLVHVALAGDRVRAVSFEGQGCALAIASASLMTARVVDLDAAAVAALFDRFDALLRGGAAGDLGELAAFAGVARFPSRRKCATLAWRALLAALERGGQTITTE